jgi:hypothetical protein
MQSPVGTDERYTLRRARVEADGLVVVFSRRTLGLPSFVIGGILVPIVLTLVRLIQGLDLGNWVVATITLVVGGLIVWLISTVILRGAAMASRRIRLATRGPTTALWTVIGGCGNPPKDQSRKFAIIAILLTTLAWVIVPAAIAIAVLT